MTSAYPDDKFQFDTHEPGIGNKADRPAKTSRSGWSGRGRKTKDHISLNAIPPVYLITESYQREKVKDQLNTGPVVDLVKDGVVVSESGRVPLTSRLERMKEAILRRGKR